MSKFVINGPKTLKGEFTIQGSKNAATPIIAATLLIKEDCILDNVPRVTDVLKMLQILKSLGAQVEWTDINQVTINTKDATLQKIDENLIKTMRSSILLLGPIIARFTEMEIPEPGGCFLGNRPLDTHIEVLKQFGAHSAQSKDTQGKTTYKVSLKNLKGTAITLPEFSVTATENAIMLAALAEGRTVIHLAAREPHVQNLIHFLDAAGAKIEEKPGSIIVIEGVRKLRTVAHTIIPDMLEVGTLSVAGGLVGKGVVLHGINPDHLKIILLKLTQIGIKYETNKSDSNYSSLKILPSNPAHFKSFTIQTMPHPPFPTDLQEPFSLLATQCKGASLIHDPLFEDRMRHIPELIKMGARAYICDPHRAVIYGPTPLSAYEIKSPNIRAGGMFVIAGLVAEGQTILHDVENTIDRGYERLDERLNELGAGIQRI